MGGLYLYEPQSRRRPSFPVTGGKVFIGTAEGRILVLDGQETADGL
ncbi:hypothetical protein ABZY03_33405 [Streptomyces klenkii]